MAAPQVADSGNPESSMCLLILLRAVDPDYPLILAGNRDEDRDRKAAPPGLFVGERCRVLSPRDRLGGGTWMGINEHRLVAGLTNIATPTVTEPPTTRGELVHLALQEGDPAAAAGRLLARLEQVVYRPFRLLVANQQAAWFVTNCGGRPTARPIDGAAVVMTNEHGPGELDLPDLPLVMAPGLLLAQRLDRLQPILTDQGQRSGHRILKLGGPRGTVSSSVIASGGDGASGPLMFLHAQAPTEASFVYRDYGNLARRLAE